MGSHIHLMDHELKFFDLEPTFEPNLTLEPKFDFPELVLVPNPIILKPKSFTSSSQILLLDQGINNDDSEMVFQNWSYNLDSFNVRVVHDPIHLGDNNTVHKKEVIKGEFLDDPQYLDSVEYLAQSGRHRNHHLEFTFYLSFLFFHAYMHSFIH